jgi:hypothetical protein
MRASPRVRRSSGLKRSCVQHDVAAASSRARARSFRFSPGGGPHLLRSSAPPRPLPRSWLGWAPSTSFAAGCCCCCRLPQAGCKLRLVMEVLALLSCPYALPLCLSEGLTAGGPQGSTRPPLELPSGAPIERSRPRCAWRCPGCKSCCPGAGAGAAGSVKFVTDPRPNVFLAVLNWCVCGCLAGGVGVWLRACVLQGRGALGSLAALRCAIEGSKAPTGTGRGPVCVTLRPPAPLRPLPSPPLPHAAAP